MVFSVYNWMGLCSINYKCDLSTVGYIVRKTNQLPMFSHQKDMDEKSLIPKNEAQWRKRDSNPPPSDCEPDALPDELFPHFFQSFLGLFGILDLIEDLLQFQGYVYIVNHRPENSVHILALKGDRREV